MLIPDKVKMEEIKNPLAGMNLPKGARLERGPTAPPSASGGYKTVEGKPSVAALAKRVAADQLIM